MQALRGFADAARQFRRTSASIHEPGKTKRCTVGSAVEVARTVHDHSALWVSAVAAVLEPVQGRFYDDRSLVSRRRRRRGNLRRGEACEQTRQEEDS